MCQADGLASQTSCSEWILGYLIDVDEELSQSVENELALIDEDLAFLLEEFLAVYLS